MSDQLKDIKLEKLKLLEEKARLVRGLPHLYGFKDYAWSRDFLDSNDKTILLTAANQLGKSTTQIRKIVEFATNVQAWPSRFRRNPRQFWYLYPTSQIATAEFHTKWKPDILPKDEFKDHPQYGWRAEFKNRGDISAIYFNSGIALYFKTYAQDVQHLQSGTVDYVACFTGDNLVDTEQGKKRIDQIKIGDRVWTKEGRLQRVYGVKSRKAEVITREFSDGSKITATPEHLFWVLGYGWKRFDRLTSIDKLCMSPAWSINLNTAEEKFISIKEGYIEGGLIPRTKQNITLNAENMFAEAVGRTINRPYTSYIEKFGKMLLGLFLMGTQSIISIITPLITKYQTYAAFPDLNTRHIIIKVNGIPNNLSLSKVSVNFVKNTLLKNLKKHLNIVTTLVGDMGLGLIKSASLAKKYLELAQIDLTKDSVPINVHRILEDVYCLQVENDRNFFVNNVCVKNCDEELPLELWDEIQFRRNAVDGYFTLVFTATLGQEFFRLAMEPKHGEKETMPFAKKIRASLFDCQRFLDGSASHWTTEKIHRTIAMCKSEAEVQRRVYGRFVKDEGLKYPSFDRVRNIREPMEIPANWPVYVGVDIGAGGDENHPSAITFVAVRPDYKYGRVFRHWRGDDRVYTMSDVASKYMELSQDLSVTAAFYDYHAKDFKTITDRMGLSFIAAEKKHDVGEQVINVLFKNGMLDIDNTLECNPIVSELTSLQLGVDKRRAKDDSVDSMRYALTKIPFDFSHVGYVPLRDNTVVAKSLSPHEAAYVERNRDRLRMVASQRNDGFNDINEEIRQWNEIIGNEMASMEDFF